jgi:hypothetical protein
MDFKSLWEDFGEIPINEDDCIEEPFLHFPKGSYRFDIWHWFEDKFDVTLGDILSGGNHGSHEETA